MRSRDAETRRRYDAEFREGAVRIVRETGKPIAQVARDLGIHDGTLGHWVNKDRIERGEKEGLTVDERTRLQQLERENSSCAWSVMSSSDPWSCGVKEARR
ncbi:MAG TPA: transposase [Acidimicrobiales bacterium]|nr:transposase [Acidimicrobiales bacterium]